MYVTYFPVEQARFILTGFSPTPLPFYLFLRYTYPNPLPIFFLKL